MPCKLTIGARLLAVASFFLLSGYSSCDPVLENNGFDLWCGDELCTWQVEKGDVERVTTWHSGDYGVALLGDEAAISQLRDIDSRQVSCLRFDLVVKAELTAEVTLELDFYGDGTSDYRQPIPSSDWASVSYLVPLPASYQGIRFRVRKNGPGQVVLAQIYADDVEDCVNPAATLVARPEGAWCAADNECASGLCGPAVTGFTPDGLVCNACDADSDCDPGQVCGVAESPLGTHLELYRACTAPATRGFGERCAGDADCTTGICNSGQCSSCASNADCDDAGQCLPRQSSHRPGDNFFAPYPHQCDAFEGGGAAGDRCLADQDCASRTCRGTRDLWVCELDGRTCANGDDCPDDLQCRNIGLADGVCQ